MDKALNLFFALPDPDRWVRFDRYPRRLVRRLLRGPPRASGQLRIFLNLTAGLRKLGVPFRVNDFRHVRRHQEEVACIVGQPYLLDHHAWRNPILFGSAVFSHPSDDPRLLERRPVRRVLVPGEWVRRMFVPYYGARVESWPTGIDLDYWSPAANARRDIDLLVYDKVLWDRERVARDLVTPCLEAAARRGLRVQVLRYGQYTPPEYRALLHRARAMLYLCEHETQGFAYQEALACDVPVLAWDQGGDWRDPTYYPHRVRFGPVNSVPYWDARCGVRFTGPGDFEPALEALLAAADAGTLRPRAYVEEHLGLEASTLAYLGHVAAVQDE